MRIHLFTTTLNNEEVIEGFISYYKSRVPGIVIHIYDMGSTDNTKNLLLDVIIDKNIYTNLDDFKNRSWKGHPADCIIICDIHDYIELDPLMVNNCSVIKTKGYDIDSINDMQPLDENRNPVYDKYCIFDTALIKEINFEGNQINPLGFFKIGEKQPNLFRLKA